MPGTDSCDGLELVWSIEQPVFNINLRSIGKVRSKRNLFTRITLASHFYDRKIREIWIVRENVLGVSALWFRPDNSCLQKFSYSFIQLIYIIIIFIFYLVKRFFWGRRSEIYYRIVQYSRSESR